MKAPAVAIPVAIVGLLVLLGELFLFRTPRVVIALTALVVVIAVIVGLLTIRREVVVSITGKRWN